MSQWIAVDLDGTLAHLGPYVGPGFIGEPIKPMLERVKKWLAEGKQVKIFTARVGQQDTKWSGDLTVDEIIQGIHDWTERHLGVRLPVTCSKDYGMTELWDDRAIQVLFNTGVRADGRA